MSTIRKGSKVRIVGTRKTGKVVAKVDWDRTYITIAWDDGSGEQTVEGKLVERI